MNENSEFIKKYIKESISILKKINPNWDDEKIEKTIKKMINKNMCNPKVTIDNNYTGNSRETTLLSVYDWCLDTKPLIAGNGTFYKPHYEGLSPTAKMIDGFLINRKKIKKEMFSIEDTSSFEYKDKDREQGNEKINANSYYGASGAPTSAFYSLYSGPATTLTAQSVISTTEQLFESFLVDNYFFIDINELMHWLEVIIDDNKDFILDDFIISKSVDDVTDRLVSKIINTDKYDYEIIHSYLSSLDNNLVTLIYYKNNLINFFKEHKKIRNLMIKILQKTKNLDYIDNDENWLDKVPKEYRQKFSEKNQSYKDWNKFVNYKSFFNPNDVPEEVKDDVEKLNNYFMKYVYVRYLSFDRVYRLKNFKRDVVTVIDTDSNILSLDTFVNYVLDEIVCGESFGRPFMKNVFIIINTIAFSITSAVTDILLTYGKYSNIPKEYRPRFNMKNEFMFSTLVIGQTKKRYISKILLREGNLMKPALNDVKGFEFKKASCSDKAEEVFMGIIKKYILDSDDININNILKELKQFELHVKNSILNGERTFLPNGNAKELAAYKNPSTVSTVRAFTAWNILNPDNQIELPSKISLVKMNIFDEKDIEDLKDTHQDIYDIIIEKIFNDTTGMFVNKKLIEEKITYINPKDSKWLEKVPKKYKTKFKKLTVEDWNKFVDEYEGPQLEKKYDVKSKGLQILAIPSNTKIPDWCIPYIDINTMVNNILAPFRPVLELFGIQFTEEGKTKNGVNRKTEKFTNVIKF